MDACFTCVLCAFYVQNSTLDSYYNIMQQATMSGRWRCCVLFLNSCMATGPLYTMYLFVALEENFMDSRYVPPSDTSRLQENTSDTASHQTELGLGEVRYNMLTSSITWSTAVTCIPSGYIIDRLGNTRSAVLFTMLAFLGSGLFSLGSLSAVPSTTPTFVLMLAGCVIIGMSQGAVRFTQARIVAHWFHEESQMPMALAVFGISSIILAFFLPVNMEHALGFPFAISSGPFLCGFSATCACFLAYLLKKNEPNQEFEDKKRVTLGDLRTIPGRLWLFLVMAGLSIASTFSILNDLLIYIQLRYGYSVTDSTYITSAMVIPFLFLPLSAAVFKKIDCNGIVFACCITCISPTIAVLAYCPSVHPVIPALLLGVEESIVTLLVWQTMVVVSPAFCIGTVSGIYFTFMNTALGLAVLAEGQLLQNRHRSDVRGRRLGYENNFTILICITSVCAICGVVLNILDIKDTCVFNQRIRKWKISRTEAMCLIGHRHAVYDTVNDGTEMDTDIGERQENS